MRNSFYWELAVEHRDKHGDLIGDNWVLISILKGKIEKDVRAISDNFDISLSTIMNKTFSDQDNKLPRGFKNYDGSTFEFVIIKNEFNDEDGIVNRDWVYPDPYKTFKSKNLPDNPWWLECWSEELPQYVLDAVEKLLEGESK